MTIRVRALVALSALLGIGAVRYASPDLDQDGDVDVCDLVLMLERWGPCLDRCCAADIDRDGVVGQRDLSELLRWWGAYDPATYPWCREVP